VQTVLVVCPTHRDRRELVTEPVRSRYRVLFHGEDASEALDRFDPIAYLEEALEFARAERIDAVLSTDDYPGSILGHVVARELGLPHVDPAVMLLCQHKYYCRLAQRQAVPEAAPRVGLVDPEKPEAPLPFPFFVKPVKSFFSIFAQTVRDQAELEAVAKEARGHIPVFSRPFNQLLERYSDLPLPASFLLAEELLGGHQVTLEGFVHAGRMRLLAITDSVMYPGTISFQRFEYPSRLAPEVQRRMESIASRLVKDVGFDNGIFNMEMFYDPQRDAVSIIEVNPRMCSQFADLMEKVHGTNTYEIQLALSLGEEPRFEPGRGEFTHAASFVLRTFQDGRVVRAPGPQDLATLAQAFPDARVELFLEPGQRLSETIQDGKSFRYGLVNLGGRGEEDLHRRFEEARRLLPFEFTA
jgi:ATP-grasp domain-containing protein